jgi:hypothetical protein
MRCPRDPPLPSMMMLCWPLFLPAHLMTGSRSSALRVPARLTQRKDSSSDCSTAARAAIVARPIAIAAGLTRDEAIARREGETLGGLWYDIQATNWLAWKWRG